VADNHVLPAPLTPSINNKTETATCMHVAWGQLPPCCNVISTAAGATVHCNLCSTAVKHTVQAMARWTVLNATLHADPTPCSTCSAVTAETATNMLCSAYAAMRKAHLQDPGYKETAVHTCASISRHFCKAWTEMETECNAALEDWQEYTEAACQPCELPPHTNL
jgi:hypothetical protein